MALPLRSSLGENNDVEARGATLRKEFGPWAPRRLAALHYAKSHGSLPQGSDREIDSLTKLTLRKVEPKNNLRRFAAQPIFSDVPASIQPTTDFMR